MGFYLVRDGEVKKRYGTRQWPDLLALARAYGWQAAGTTLDEVSGLMLTGKWSGTYTGMDGQLVSSEDASNLADALERALVHFPRQDAEQTLDYQIKTHLWRPATLDEARALRTYLGDDEPSLVREAMGESALTGLITFCREGGFRID